jgi:hypothetical protein
MSTFAYTAPIFTKKQEQNEWLSLTEQEKAQIRHDLYGVVQDKDVIENDESNNALENLDRDDIDRGVASMISHGIHYDYAMESRGLELMREVFQTSLNSSDTLVYQQALDKVPDIVARETKLVDFLQCESYDPWAAAQRIARYWSLRQELFDSDALFPLTLKDALHHEVPYLQEGFVYVLPPDQHGRPVLFFDRIRCIKQFASRKQVLRCFFYTACVAAVNMAQLAQLYRARQEQRQQHLQHHQQQQNIQSQGISNRHSFNQTRNSGIVLLINCRVRSMLHAMSNNFC